MGWRYALGPFAVLGMTGVFWGNDAAAKNDWEEHSCGAAVTSRDGLLFLIFFMQNKFRQRIK